MAASSKVIIIESISKAKAATMAIMASISMAWHEMAAAAAAGRQRNVIEK
jgi:hypothetical protein